MRLIDADELLERLRNAEAFFKHETAGDFDTGRALGLNEARQKVAEQPTIEAELVKWGKWIDVDYKTLEHGFFETYPNEGVCCSECRTGFKKSRQLIRNFCPNCGARMRGDEK